MSFSSSSASGSLSKDSGSTMTWHVEHAHERSQAPVGQHTGRKMDERPTLQVDVVLVRERQEVVALVALDRLDRVALRVDKVDLDAGR